MHKTEPKKRDSRASQKRRDIIITSVIAVMLLAGALVFATAKLGLRMPFAPPTAEEALAAAVKKDAKNLFANIAAEFAQIELKTGEKEGTPVPGSKFTQLAAALSSDTALADGTLTPTQPALKTDLNGDGQTDALQIYTAKADDSAALIALAALTQKEGDPRILPAVALGSNLKIEELKDVNSSAHLLAAAATGEQIKYVFTASETNLNTQINTDASAAKNVEKSLIRAEKFPAEGKTPGEGENLEYTLRGKIELGRPAALEVNIPTTHTLIITQKGTAAFQVIDDKSAVLEGGSEESQKSADSKELEIKRPGKFSIIVQAVETVVADVDLHLTLKAKPKPKPPPQAAVEQVGYPTHDAAGRPILYLTFDDGPSRYTVQILDLLKQYGAKATFFWIGSSIGAGRDVMERAKAEGHTIGNHTWSHPDLTKLKDPELNAEIDKAQAVNGKSTCLRPPYGATNAHTKSVFAAKGLREILWDVDTLDWQKPGAGTIANTILNQSRPGYVVLMHDGGGERTQTVAAVAAVLPQLAAQGYVFHPVPDCR
ncbi:MAG: polysaccharide deacetylase family protein [Microbacteriaceae bacterium]|nr:polysaccharide deacetylase family protein [Microbacteriaceae bacterium]